jgi:hypothetical protein
MVDDHLSARNISAWLSMFRLQLRRDLILEVFRCECLSFRHEIDDIEAERIEKSGQH